LRSKTGFNLVSALLILSFYFFFCQAGPSLAESNIMALMEDHQEELSRYIENFHKDSVEFDSDFVPLDPEEITWICFKTEHIFAGYDSNTGVFFCMAPCATGRNSGQKQRVGDMRTPEGNFKVQQIQDSSWWEPYVDKQTGEKTGYGPYFIRIDTEKWKGIGVHGTDEGHLNEIGTNASHGCIRLQNNDLKEVVSYVEVGQQVIILP